MHAPGDSSPSPVHSLPRTLGLLGLWLMASSHATAQADTLPVSYYTRAAPEYKRKLDNEGNPRREFYAISFGGRMEGTIWDNTQSKEDFPRIAGIVAEQLARNNYHFAPNSRSAHLLVSIYWGRTDPAGRESFEHRIGDVGAAVNGLALANQIPPPANPNSPEEGASAAEAIASRNGEIAEAASALETAIALMDMENRVRNRRNEENARVLGYVDEMAHMRSVGGFTGSDRFEELRTEIEESRYYIVLIAYDFKLASQKQKKKVLWTAHMSIRTRANNFTDSLETMVARAASHFGQNSGRLVRNYKGEVEIGDLEFIGTEDDENATSPPAK